MRGARLMIAVCVLVASCLGILWGQLRFAGKSENVVFTYLWIVAQAIPYEPLRRSLLEVSWRYWDEQHAPATTALLQASNSTSYVEEVPSVNVQDFVSLEDPGAALLEYLEDTFGSDWRSRPLLLRALWTEHELAQPERRLSVAGLQKETSLEIPYFTDARRSAALTPDGRASVAAIVANISHGAPHKIGSQLLVQTYPELVREIVPTALVTTLFGDFFQPDRVRGWGPNLWLPALTTVPVFIASTAIHDPNSAGTCVAVENNDNDNEPVCESFDESSTSSSAAYTALHCEPIGNVAVQLSGRKEWTLVDPVYSFLLRPRLAPDGRAFFASFADNLDTIPRYHATTAAGDAIWVPTWTWHRVDYQSSSTTTTTKDATPRIASGSDGQDDDDGMVALGGSVFHFRPWDFVKNNKLFAILLIPAMIGELLGISTQ